MADLRAKVENLLDEIIDPCSAGMGMPIGLMSMGLIKELNLSTVAPEKQKVEILLRLTSPCCMMAPHFAVQAKSKLEQVEEIVEVEVKVCPKIDWEPSHMHPDVRSRLPRPKFLSPF